MAPPPKWPKPPVGAPKPPAAPSPTRADSPDRSPGEVAWSALWSTLLVLGPAGPRPDRYSLPPRFEPIIAPARLDVGTNSSPPRPRPNPSDPPLPIAPAGLAGTGAEDDRPMLGVSADVRPGGGGVVEVERTKLLPTEPARLGLGVAVLLSWSISRRPLLLVNTGATGFRLPSRGEGARPSIVELNSSSLWKATGVGATISGPTVACSLREAAAIASDPSSFWPAWAWAWACAWAWIRTHHRPR